MVDDDVAAARQRHAALEGAGDLLFDAVGLEQRLRARCAGAPCGTSSGATLLEEGDDRLVALLVVDDQALDRLVEEVAGHLEGDVDLLVDEPGDRRRLGLLLEPRPEPREDLHVAADLLEPLALGGRAHDQAGVLDAELLAEVAQAVALALSEAPRDADPAAAGHVDDVAPGERDVHGQPGALVPIGSFMTWTTTSWPCLSTSPMRRPRRSPSPVRTSST